MEFDFSDNEVFKYNNFKLLIGKVELKTCNKCQATEFDNTAVFCQNCGERFIINSSNKYNLTSPNKKQPTRNLKKK